MGVAALRDRQVAVLQCKLPVSTTFHPPQLHSQSPSLSILGVLSGNMAAVRTSRNLSPSQTALQKQKGDVTEALSVVFTANGFNMEFSGGLTWESVDEETADLLLALDSVIRFNNPISEISQRGPCQRH